MNKPIISEPQSISRAKMCPRQIVHWNWQLCNFI